MHVSCDERLEVMETLSGLSTHVAGCWCQSLKKSINTRTRRGALFNPDWPDKIHQGESPREFDPAILQPVATLENAVKFFGNA